MLDWLNDPALNSMDPSKRDLFKLAATSLAGKSQNAMAPINIAVVITPVAKVVAVKAKMLVIIEPTEVVTKQESFILLH